VASVLDSALFGDLWSTAEMRAVWSDAATVQRWLDAEAALALAEADLGIVPRSAAEDIARNARVERLDLTAMKRHLDHMKHPIMPLVRCLQAACDPAAGEWIHWGATTQDIMDTGLVLQLKAAHGIVARDLGALAGRLAALARRHRDTVQAGRTHGQQALPITFGYKLAVWLAEVRRHQARLEAMAPRVFVGQLGGAVGTLASIGPAGPRLQEGYCARLGLGVPEIAWHTARDGIAEAVCALALVGGTLAKIADEIIGLQRTEVAELEEPFHLGKVGSSTMPHKRNPSMCEGVVALGRVLHAQVAPALAGLSAQNERDKRGNLAEAAFVSEACCLLAGMLGTMRAVLDGLRVYPERMARNLERLGGLLLSERVMLALGRRVGRQQAHEVVYELCMRAVEEGAPLRGLLLDDPRVAAHLGAAELDARLAPARNTGLAGVCVDRVAGPGPAA
jgi:adenylosuccinate lyase